jgi:hypothetical protein
LSYSESKKQLWQNNVETNRNAANKSFAKVGETE